MLDSATQLNAVGQPGTTEHLSETLTNDGQGSVHVGLSSRTLSAYHPVSTKSLSLTTGGGLQRRGHLQRARRARPG